jgi:signal transduction histidine kinase
LAADFGLLALILVVGGGVLVHQSFKNHYRRDLDEQLGMTLEWLRLNVVNSENGPEVTLPAETRQNFVPPNGNLRWFVVRTVDGQPLQRGSDLIPMPDLPMLQGSAAGPEFADLTLPDGHPVRVAGQFIVPPQRTGVTASVAGAPSVHLAAALSWRPMLAHLTEVRRTILVASGVALVLLIALAAWLVHRALRPLQALSGEIAQFPVDSSRRFSAPRRAAELAPVVGRLNDLMERVGRTLARERGFAMGAAHELRTPLAGLRARLELALSRPRTADEYRAELHEALEIERGLESMVTHLLLLARLGQDGAGAFAIKSIHVGRLLRECWGEFFDRAEQRRLRVGIRVPDAAPDLESSPDLIALVIRNLFDNAVSYTPEEGRIEIVAQAVVDGWALCVTNTNPGLRSHDLPHLSEPFWRARHDEGAPDGRHAGLGLALCQRIARELGGSLGHELTEDGLVRACLTLPYHPPPRSERGSGL